MALYSPLLRSHQEAEASLLQYGPEIELPGQTGQGVYLVETFGELELEYAALRKHCVLIDMAQRGTLELTGPDRLDFLNRMLTQELKGIAPGQVRRSFWLNRKGRIDADLRVIELGDRTLLDVDVHAVSRTMEGLSSYIITEDCAIRDVTAQHHRLGLHGPTGVELLAALAGEQAGAVQSLEPDRTMRLTLAGESILLDRNDATGEIGLELLCPTEHVEKLYRVLIESGSDPDAHNHEAGAALARHAAPETLATRVRLRPAGWHAYNVARVENGTALYNLDFTTENLPAETGVIDSRVSFTKGCYLGQEIVARMHARGHPKQLLVALRIEQPARQTAPAEFPDLLQPVTGSQIYTPPASGAPLADAVGAVTSSTFSPMLGAAAICFAQVKFDHATAGNTLLAQTDGGLARAIVQTSLRFVTRS